MVVFQVIEVPGLYPPKGMRQGSRPDISCVQDIFNTNIILRCLANSAISRYHCSNKNIQYQFCLMTLGLSLDKAATAIFFAELWLFNFSGWIARHVFKKDSVRTLVTRQRGAELCDLVFSTGKARL
jgi:hypothetical protein